MSVSFLLKLLVCGRWWDVFLRSDGDENLVGSDFCMGRWAVKQIGKDGGGGCRRSLCPPKVRGDMLQSTDVDKFSLRQDTTAVSLGRVRVILIFTAEDSLL